MYQKSEGIMTDLKSPLNELSMSVLSDSVVSLRFDLPEPHIWGTVTNVYFVDSVVFIVDGKQGNIFRFNRDGSYLNKIGNRGEGPGEFRKLTNVMVDEDFFYAGNISERRLYCYTHDGRFVKTITFPFELIYDDVVPLSEGRFLCHDINGYKGESKVWIMNGDGQIDTTLLRHDAVYPYSSSSFSTISYTDTIGIYKILDPITGRIYIYDGGSEALKVQQRFISNTNGLDKFVGYDLLPRVEDEYAYPVYFSEIGNHIYFIWNTSAAKAFHVIYSKNTHDTQAYRRMKMDVSDVSCFSIPVSTNISAMVTVLTNEYSMDCFPNKYKDDLSERTVVVNLYF